jgi:hypothetical protein
LHREATASDPKDDAKPPIPPAGPESPKPPIPPAGSGEAKAGRRSQCEPFHADIESKLKQGLSAQRIYQDLICETGFAGGYDAVKRYVRKLKAKRGTGK